MITDDIPGRVSTTLLKTAASLIQVSHLSSTTLHALHTPPFPARARGEEDEEVDLQFDVAQRRGGRMTIRALLLR